MSDQEQPEQQESGGWMMGIANLLAFLCWCIACGLFVYFLYRKNQTKKLLENLDVKPTPPAPTTAKPTTGTKSEVGVKTELLS